MSFNIFPRNFGSGQMFDVAYRCDVEAPAANTAAPETTAELSDCPPAEGGCGATLSTGVMALLSVAAVLIVRKKKEE